ncbi:hypothetical protein ACWEQ1_23955 [Streptomyces nodosus]
MVFSSVQAKKSIKVRVIHSGASSGRKCAAPGATAPLVFEATCRTACSTPLTFSQR